MKILDEVYADTWDRREINLGTQTYGEYLDSVEWKGVKSKAAKRKNYQKCECCTSTKVELHHTSYKWINTPHELRTIVALCRTHHQEVHDLAKTTGTSVRLATNATRLKYESDWTKPNR